MYIFDKKINGKTWNSLNLQPLQVSISQSDVFKTSRLLLSFQKLTFLSTVFWHIIAIAV